MSHCWASASYHIEKKTLSLEVIFGLQLDTFKLAFDWDTKPNVHFYLLQVLMSVWTTFWSSPVDIKGKETITFIVISKKAQLPLAPLCDPLMSIKLLVCESEPVLPMSLRSTEGYPPIWLPTYLPVPPYFDNHSLDPFLEPNVKCHSKIQ